MPRRPDADRRPRRRTAGAPPPRRPGGAGGPDDGGRDDGGGRRRRRIGASSASAIVDRRHRDLPAVQRRDRPVDRRAVVPERRLRLRLLDADLAPRSACSCVGAGRRRWSSCSATSGWPAASRPPPDRRGRRDRAALVDRINEAAAGRGPRGASAAAGYGGRRRFGRAAADRLRGRRHARPRRRSPAWSSPGSRCSSRWSSAASSAAAWETVLLWMNRVPFSPTARGRHRPDLRPRHRLLPVRAAVPAARPGRCSTASSWPRCSSSLGALPRRRVARRARSSRPRSGSTSRSSAGCSCCRSRSATSSTSSSSSTAPVASRTGVSFTDQNAQFLAFDVADRRLRARRRRSSSAAAFTRMIWPLGLTIARLVRRLARHRSALPRGRPALHGRAQPVRPGRALHRATTSR